jgi:hypothetical protein
LLSPSSRPNLKAWLAAADALRLRGEEEAVPTPAREEDRARVRPTRRLQ